MVEKEQLKREAYNEYIKEKDQVDQVIQKMIAEDQRMVQLNKMKQDQAKQDMVMSQQEKREMLRRQKELEM